MIDSQQVISTLSEVSSFSAPTLNLILLFLICAAAVCLCFMAGSFRPLIYRVWLLITSDPPKHEQATQEWLERDEQLINFRVRTGLRADTIQTVERLTHWVQTHPRESFLRIHKVGRYFDLEDCRLHDKKIRGWRYELSLGAVMLSAILILSLSLMGMFSSSAWLSFKGSETRFFMTPQEAHRVFPARKPITPDLCMNMPADVTSKTGFSAAEITVICNSFKAPKLNDWIGETVRLQKKVCAFLSAVWVFLIFFVYGEIASNSAARAMRRRLRQNVGYESHQSTAIA